MTHREVWILAGEIVLEYGEFAADYIMGRLSDVISDPVAVEDWRRIAGAIDDICSRERKC